MIIKLTDNILNVSAEYTQGFCDVFNESFKSRFVWWLHCAYVVSLEDLSELMFIEYSQKSNADIETVLTNNGTKFIKISDISNELVDYTTSIELINTEKYKKPNSITPSADININDLKQFRTWLADSLLNGFVYEYSETQKTMLQYYKNDMYNDVIGAIKDLNSYYNNSSNLNKNSQTCCCSARSTTLVKDLENNLQMSNSCVNLYVSKLHNEMVELFTDIDFWSSEPVLNKSFLESFKSRIDNIINCEFEIKSSYVVPDLFSSCNSSQKTQNKTILKNLSTAIQYIINNEISDHYNFISEALYYWAEYMYDYMEF